MFAEIGGNTGFARSGTVPAMARSRKSPKPNKPRSANRGDDAIQGGEHLPAKSKNPRGRPPTKIEPPRYPENLIMLAERVKAGLSQDDVAEKAGLSSGYYGDIERGRKRLNTDTARLIRKVLPITGLFEVAINTTIPVRYIVGAESSNIWQDVGIGETGKMAPTNEKLQAIKDCFAVEIGDESADLDYPRETTLYLRPIIPGEVLPIRCPILARFYKTPRSPDSAPSELLYGLLDRTAVGDIVLLTRSATTQLPSGKLIQSGSERLRAVSARLVNAIPQPPMIEYTARPDDPAEILGIVVYALMPVLGGNVSRETR